MDPNPPTMGDLAWSAVEDTRRLMQKFAQRLEALERRIAKLERVTNTEK